MGDLVRETLAKPILLTDQLMKRADEAATCKLECAELISRADKLNVLLRQAVRVSNDLYERPTRRILDQTVRVLDKALSLVLKCRSNGFMTRALTITSAAAFPKILSLLENSIADVSWLLRISASADDSADDVCFGLPPIAQNEPLLYFIWDLIATLSTGSADDRADAAASLVSLALDDDHFRKLIVEEGAVGPLLKLLIEGVPEGQENAAKAIGLLGRDWVSVEHMIHAGVCSVFAEILKEAPMKVQAMAAWAVSEFAANVPLCQDFFAQHNIIRLLINHLAFETVQEHNKYAVVGKSIRAAVDSGEEKSMLPHYHRQSGANNRARELEEPATKTHMKAMAARALGQLAKGNSAICKSITESRALLCFAILLEKGDCEVQFSSAMALKEITAVAELNAELRRSAFKPNSPACKSAVNQLLRIVIKGEFDGLLLPCINAIGNLARTFKARESRILISPLVKLLDEREAVVSRETSVALTKFACSENYLHVHHSKAIIDAGGVSHLVQLVYVGEQIVQSSALILLCNIAMHVPDNEELAQEKVLIVLDWASKQSVFCHLADVEDMLHFAKTMLQLYQRRR